MSMPKTCPGAQESAGRTHTAGHTGHAHTGHAHTGHEQGAAHETLPNLIPRLLMPVNHEHLKKICSTSICSVCAEYQLSAQQQTVQTLQRSVGKQCFTNSLALFFLLLNVDMRLKTAILDGETPAQQAKIANFLMNLRKHLIPEYLSEQRSDTCTFATKCQDAWSVA